MSRLFPPEEVPSILSRVTDYITNSSIYRNDNARVILFSIGTGLALFKTISYTQAILAPLFRRGHDLLTRYGKDSWAVITGASDGIGKGYAFELAKRGFNIVLVGRNKSKLEQVEMNLKLAHPKVETRVVVADFADAYQEGFAEKVLEQVKDLDVSILINNAGVSNKGVLHEVPTATITNLILTNCLGHALITRVLLPKLALRYNKSAIINTASLAGSSPRPYVTLYSSAKVFHDHFSRGLAYEYSNIDILSLKPGLVQTKMTNYVDINIKSTTVEDHVSVALRDLGSVSHTYGHWKHRFDAFFVNNLGDLVGNPYWKNRYQIK